MTGKIQSLTIGALGRTCGVSTPTIRYYEKIGLLPLAERNQSGQRRYGRDTVERLTFIRRCRAFGFSTRQVQTLLLVPSGSSADCQASRDIAEGRIGEIRTQIQDLQELEKSLKGLINSCKSNCADNADVTCAAFLEMKMPD